MKNTKILFTTAIAFSLLTGTTLAQGQKTGPGGGNRGGFDQGGRGAPGDQGGNRFGGPPGGQGGQGGNRFGGGRGGPPEHPILTAIDKNKDGVLTEDEIKNAVAALKTLDKNKDGKLTQDEMRPSFGGRGGPGGGRMGGQGGRGGFGGPPGGQGGPGGRGGFSGPPGGQAGGQSGSFNYADRIMVHDKNKDGKVSKAELPTRMQSMLDRGDLNKDGFIDKAEANKMAANMGPGDSSSGGRGSKSGGRPQRPQFDK